MTGVQTCALPILTRLKEIDKAYLILLDSAESQGQDVSKQEERNESEGQDIKQDQSRKGWDF